MAMAMSSTLCPFSCPLPLRFAGVVTRPRLPGCRFRSPLLRQVSAAGRNSRPYSSPLPSDEDPPEAPEDTSHGLSPFEQFSRQVDRARRYQDALFPPDPSLLSALSENTTRSPAPSPQPNPNDFFANIDRAIDEKPLDARSADELSPEEELDLEEIQQLQGTLSTLSDDEDSSESSGEDIIDAPANGAASRTMLSEFELDVDEFGKLPVRILEPKFKMTLAELLDESRIVPLSVYGDLEVMVSGIQHDSRNVSSGDLFVCCGMVMEDLIVALTEADKRGAVAVVADQEINIHDTLSCKALVIVEDTRVAMAMLAASFYGHPSKGLTVIGVTGTDGIPTVAHLVKSVYEAMGLRIGIVGVLGNYVYGDNKLEALPDVEVDSVEVHKLMAKMAHNKAEAVVLESLPNVSLESAGEEVDFDIAVFTNLRYDSAECSGSQEEYMKSKAWAFMKMVDPERHRKVVNVDDPAVSYFVALGNPDVPIVTYALDDKKADVHILKHQLSLFETEVLVQTPQGILEISSGLLGKDNVYSILAAVAVGVAVGAPLEDIVRGIEEVDAVPGIFELIDEEQAFGVIVDHARTPAALSRLLDSVKELGPRRIITVFGCCGEKERGKRPLMTKIATEKSDVVMLTSDNPGNEDPLDILDDMLAGVGWTMQDYLKHGENDYYPPLKNGHRLFLHDIRRVAVRAAVAMGEEGDIVVVAGKGHETYQIEADKKDFFDDREECREALHYVDELHQAGIDTSEFPWRLPESH